MNDSFRITYLWDKVVEPVRYAADNYVEATSLFLTLKHFLALMHGYFFIHIHDISLKFDLSSDLSTIFEEIPDFLENIASKPESRAEIYFFEEGTDLTLSLDRKGDIIDIRFVKGLLVGKRFVDLPNISYQVPVDLFLHEWINFVQIILNMLTTLQPTLQNDESYRKYLSRLQSLIAYR